jgi:hypothetical protein
LPYLWLGEHTGKTPKDGGATKEAKKTETAKSTGEAAEEKEPTEKELSPAEGLAKVFCFRRTRCQQRWPVNKG